METKLNGLTLKVLPDDNPIHPRRDCDNLGTIMAWHRRYDFNDGKNEYDTPDDFWESEEGKNVYASLPVYMLDHSGIRLSISSFGDPWDSGRLGFIYCTESQAKAWLGKDCTPDQAKVEMKKEIETYDDFLSSEYCYFLVEGLDGECLDSCGGFQNTGDTTLFERMKEYAGVEYAPLFDKLAVEKSACM